MGHEPDVTIADFVADLRAATPSNAAELAVPDQNEVYSVLLGQKNRLEQSMTRRLTLSRQALDRVAKSRVMTDPKTYFQDKRILLDYLSRRLSQGLAASVAGERQRFTRLAASLDALSPLKVLGRGYAIAWKEDGQVISQVAQAVPGEHFTLRLSDGSVPCRVEQFDDQ